MNRNSIKLNLKMCENIQGRRNLEEITYVINCKQEILSECNNISDEERHTFYGIIIRRTQLCTQQKKDECI